MLFGPNEPFQLYLSDLSPITFLTNRLTNTAVKENVGYLVYEMLVSLAGNKPVSHFLTEF